MSKEILCCNGFTLLSTVIGLENFPSLSQPIRCELVTCLFPRFAQFVCFYFEFSLAHCDWLQSKLLSKVKRMIVRMRKFVKRIGAKAWGFNNFHGKTSMVAKRKALSASGQRYPTFEQPGPVVSAIEKNYQLPASQSVSKTCVHNFLNALACKSILWFKETLKNIYLFL